MAHRISHFARSGFLCALLRHVRAFLLHQSTRPAEFRNSKPNCFRDATETPRADDWKPVLSCLEYRCSQGRTVAFVRTRVLLCCFARTNRLVLFPISSRTSGYTRVMNLRISRSGSSRAAPSNLYSIFEITNCESTRPYPHSGQTVFRAQLSRDHTTDSS